MPAFAAALASAIALGVALLAPNLSAIHRFNNAESLIPIFLSLDRWTPFYWGQTRFGMLVPLLASGIRNPLLNLLFQTQINVLSLFGSFLLFDCLVNPPSSGWVRITRACLAMSLCLAILRNDAKLYHLGFLPGHPYSVSLCLLTAALVTVGFGSNLVAVPSVRFAGFFGLSLLALYVNEGNFLAALILTMALPTEGGYHVLRRLASASAIVAGELLMRFLSSFYGTPLPFRLAPLEYLPDAATSMLDQLWAQLVSPFSAAVFGILVVSSVVLTFFFWRINFRRQVLTLLAVGMTSVAVAILTTSLEWLEHNLYDVRYWTTPLLLVLMSGTLAVTSRAAVPLPRTTAVIAAVILASVSVYEFGFPSMQRMRASLLEATTYHHHALVSLGCTHFVGDAWQVWNSAFGSRLIDPGRPITPVTDRAQAIFEGAPALDGRGLHYCSICGDADFEAVRREFHLPDLKVERQVDRICLLTPQ